MLHQSTTAAWYICKESTINSTSDYHQNVDLLHQPTAAQGSCCLSSCTQLVCLRAFSLTTSSTSDGTPGGVSTRRRCIIIESGRQQRIIVFSSTRSAARFLQKVCKALNWGFKPKYYLRLSRGVLNSPIPFRLFPGFSRIFSSNGTRKQ